MMNTPNLKTPASTIALNNVVPLPMPFNTEADFTAVLTYRTAEQGGRNVPAQSGYRPQLKFDFSKMQTSGEQQFIGKSRAYPGDTVEAEIRILAIPFFTNKLAEGMSFEFREGRYVIDTGVIKEIINADLRKAIPVV